ncbi:chorion peroxidase-like isoform X1 [Myzus persicae]|uniref:chorion peroxidase-like isoform X1 n=2 Tax=Myzus persicae TaxID=13164 RepID=UPI000B934619|nr:chorion peroxidase-like isoform X1 [Myzus persicae]XP_022177220.1 chorion peroxidase-like isoform X1 [Myzus persicae]XP_022177221.1 chorion peroxidase-like isoform X1 [Myzus persicae]XP_022177222.1 chorion peroxidase-like isoform X1 [Myzus persicae]XP_022177223.1 chorion peroxidase-like isoform X1 [Myzus persicae]
MATECTPLTNADDVTPVSGSGYISLSKHETDHTPPCLKPRCCVYAALLSLVLMAIIVGTSYYVGRSQGNSTVIQPASVVSTLLQLRWPLQNEADEGITATSIIQRTVVINATGDDLMSAVEGGYKSLKAKEDLEKNFPTIDGGTPSYRHQQVMKSGPESIGIARNGYVENIATEKLRLLLNVTKDQDVMILAGNVTVFNNSECTSPEPVICPVQSRYRTVEGICNNVLDPLKGAAMMPFHRVLPADYSDGVWKPRKATDGSELPSAKQVSEGVHRPSYEEDHDFTVMLAVWGQFMDHDITATALSRGRNGSAISCCGSVGKNITHPECFPVIVHEDDKKCGKCMEFVRSSPASTCSFGPREQLNQASSYLDGSSVYGNTRKLQNDLRSWTGGRMKVFVTEHGKQLLPPNKDPLDGCNEESEMKKGRYCFLSGDARSNENMHLTTLHLIMVRQHNMIAGRLSSLNPHWDDEHIFQETRHIVTAQIQHITYNEFLPVLLGDSLMKRLDLYSRQTGHWNGYNSAVDPTISNNFATAAFRFAHTLIPSMMKFLRDDNSDPEFVEMRKMLFNPYRLYTCGGVDSVIRGAMNTSAGKSDAFFTPEVTRHLFEKNHGSKRTRGQCGLDLVALNIQRGRDHGLPAYPRWRETCGFPRPRSFSDLEGQVETATLQRISKLYKSIDDLDLYTGLLSEKPLEGSILGPTITCLLADQFLRVKSGDRYWYETDEKPQAFNEDQLSEIRKTTFAAIICDNSDEIESVQMHVMQSARKVGNGRVGCDSLIKTSLDPWKEEFDVAVPKAALQDPTATPQDSTATPQDTTTTAQDSATAAAEVTTGNNINNTGS